MPDRRSPRQRQYAAALAAWPQGSAPLNLPLFDAVPGPLDRVRYATVDFRNQRLRRLLAAQRQPGDGGLSTLLFVQSNVTVTPGVIALTAALQAATPKVVPLPSAISLAASLLAPTPIDRVLPGAISLSATTPAATPAPHVLPGSIALATTLFAPSLTATVHPDAIALSTALQTARPQLATPAGSVTLSAGLFDPRPLVRPLPDAIALSLATPTVTPLVRVLPSGIALAWTLPDPTIPAGGGVTATPGSIALVTSLFAPSLAYRTTADLIGLSLAPPAPTPKVVVHPGSTTVGGQAATFDGTQHLRGERPGAVDTAIKSHLFAAWVRPNSDAAPQTLCCLTTDANELVTLDQFFDTPAFIWQNATATEIAFALASGPLTLGAWSLVIGYWDETAKEAGVSVNGGAFATSASSPAGSSSVAGGPLIGIGGMPSGPTDADVIQPLDGRLQHVAICVEPTASWTAIRDRLWNSGAGIDLAELSSPEQASFGVAEWWRLDEPSSYRRGGVLGTVLHPVNGPGSTTGHVASTTGQPSVDLALGWAVPAPTISPARRVYPAAIGLLFVVRIADVFKIGEIWLPPQVDVGDAVLETVGITDALLCVVEVVDVLIGGTVAVTDSGLYVVGVGDSIPTPVGAGDVAAAEVAVTDALLGGVGASDTGPQTTVEVTDQNAGGTTGAGDTQLGMVGAGDVVLNLGVTDVALGAVAVSDLGDS